MHKINNNNNNSINSNINNSQINSNINNQAIIKIMINNNNNNNSNITTITKISRHKIKMIKITTEIILHKCNNLNNLIISKMTNSRQIITLN